MKQYVCGVCGFVYDEAAGYPEGGIAPGTTWAELPSDWVCPLCGATKSEFEEQAAASAAAPAAQVETAEDQVRELSFGELSAVCSNLAKGCAKQFLPEESNLFDELAGYFRKHAEPVGEDAGFETLLACIKQDLGTGYVTATGVAGRHADRGALRALVWGEKVTKILQSLLNRYDAKGDALLEKTNVFVCEVCGFVFVGNEAPAVCPVCKVQNSKLAKIERS